MRLSVANDHLLGLSLILLVALLAAVCLADSDGSVTNGPKIEPQTARSKFTALKVFDFTRYKTVFKKSYASFIEEAARAKLFLGRAFRAFVSAVSYKYRRASSYLAVNQMSDWTPEEVRKLHRRRASKAHDKRRFESIADNEPLPAVSADEVENELSTIVGRGNKQPELQKLIAHELAKAEEQRLRRDTKLADQREISMDDIAREPTFEASDVGQRIESNNPDYEPPEQASSGLAVSPFPLNSLSNHASNLINAMPGKQFISQVIQSAADDTDETDETNTEERLPDEVFIDHRDECMFKPRNQGSCGSCYAFAAVAVYEWLLCRATGRKVALSEQYIVDCGGDGGEFDITGCDGGMTSDIPKFVNKRGLELRRNYPYVDRADQCPFDGNDSDSAKGYLLVETIGARYVGMYGKSFEKLLATRPMLITILVGDSFSEYGGGVDAGLDCDPEGAHAVVLVGSGREDNEEYWLIRNSYSPVFGEGGYYKLNKKAQHCIEDQEAFTLGRLNLVNGKRIKKGQNKRLKRLELLKQKQKHKQGE